MSILRQNRASGNRPSLYSLLGCRLPKPSRPFGVGLVDFPDGPYDDEPSELPLSVYYEPEADDAPAGGAYWTEELDHLESLRLHATASRRAEIDRRIDGVLGMLERPAPVRAERPRPVEPSPEERAWWTQETDRLAAESFERQLAEAWALDRIAAGAERWDGREWEEQEACRIGGGR